MNSDKYVSLAIQVRLSRLDKTQDDIAKESGISPAQLSSYMSGRVGWKLAVLDKLAPALHWKSAVEIRIAADEEATIHERLFNGDLAA